MSKPTLRKMNTITLSTFNDLLSCYPTLVPAKLHELDALRYETIPGKLQSRWVEGRPYLEKNEVEKLVEWKLRHGTFRPNLLKLVQSNSDSDIETATREAYSLVSRSSQERIHAAAKAVDPLPAIERLAKLRGIGPATASVLLSVFVPDTVPFFSDELYAWMALGEPHAPRDSKWSIKYNLKEYRELVSAVGAMRERLDVRAVDMERVAWVMGKEGKEGVGGGTAAEVKAEAETTEEKDGGKEKTDVVESEMKGESKSGMEEAKKANQKLGRGKAKAVVPEKQEESEVETEEPKKPTQEVQSKKGTKRKTEGEKSPAENLRRSTRRKTGN